jgi:hypothetical protein
MIGENCKKKTNKYSKILFLVHALFLKTKHKRDQTDNPILNIVKADQCRED